MSQISKRNADDAAIDDPMDQVQAKKKRRTRNRSSLAKSRDEGTVQKTIKSEAIPPLAAKLPTHDASSVSKSSPVLEEKPVILTMGHHEVAQQTLSHHEQPETPAAKQEILTVQKSTKEHAGKGSKTKNKKTRSKQLGTSKSREQEPSPSWRISSAFGGTFINHDPLLTPDNQYVILATTSSIQIYSSKTSLLVRSIQPVESSPIVSYALSTIHKTRVLVAFLSGMVMAYDLETGRKLDEWQTQSGLRHLTSVPGKGETESVLTTHCSEEQEDCLRSSILAPKGKLRTTKLLQKPILQSAICVSTDGSVIVLAGRDRVYVGYVRDQVAKNEMEREYIWHELPIAGRISSWDARFQNRSKTTVQLPSLSLAVGLSNGSILVFEDLLQKLLKRKDTSDLDDRGRRLHWHRTAARSMKWSRDGNYLISGGDESVLVIWQLETSQRQYLPHLSTSILNITVSRSGAYYALRLADNSVMVLSTADLIPSTNITGLSIKANQGSPNPVILHPSNSNQLLAAVPSRSVGNWSGTATHLQTFDVDTNLQLHKQALTRNLTTAVNVGPNGTPLREPDVKSISVSCDGKWLATVDEWSQNRLDLQGLYVEEDGDTNNDLSEITMRFWSWNVLDNSWDLVTRVDQPHTPSILAMARNPVSLEFTTMGKDGSLKVWTPKARVRDGIAVRNAAGELLYTWSCSRQYQIEKSLFATAHLESPSGAIAYSDDGTVLAVSWSSLALPQRHVHLVNPRNGEVSLSQPRLLSEGPASLSFLGRYLLALSDQVIVFDAVTLQNVSVTTLDSRFTGLPNNAELPRNKFLAVSHQTNTYAIGVNTNDIKAHRSGLISVFKVESADQAATAEFEVASGVSTLIADPAGRGFIVIDQEARIRRISPPGSINTPTTSMSLITQPQMNTQLAKTGKGVEEIFGSRDQTEHDGADTQTQQKLLEDADSVETKSRNLNDLFIASGSTAALPAVNELFERVAKAVAGIRVGA